MSDNPESQVSVTSTNKETNRRIASVKSCVAVSVSGQSGSSLNLKTAWNSADEVSIVIDYETQVLAWALLLECVQVATFLFGVAAGCVFTPAFQQTAYCRSRQ